MVYDMVMKKSHFGRHGKIQLNYFLIKKMYIQYDAILLFFFLPSPTTIFQVPTLSHILFWASKRGQ